MNEAALAGTNFDSFDVTRFFERDPEDEIPIDVAAAWGNFERRIRANDEIRLAELPAGIEFRCRRKISGGSFRHSSLDPFLKQGNFIGRKMQVVVEFPFAGFG